MGKEKLLIAITLIFLSISMVSCSSESDDFDNNQSYENTVENTVTRSSNDNISKDSSYIRIKMFETVNGYDVTISDVHIYNKVGVVPSFGNNFEGSKLGTKSYDSIYDSMDGNFAIVKAGMEIQLSMVFDARLSSNDGDIININNVSIVLNDEPMVLYPGTLNEITVKVNSSMLNLQTISFGASVQDTREKIYE